MARAAGAFFVTLIAISYLFGEFRSGTGFLVALLVSAIVAGAVAWWLRLESGHDDVEQGIFDERATRRAVRRGVARTALVAVVWVGLGLFVLGIASAVWQTRGDRDSHFGLVAGYGFFVSHPGFRLENGAPQCCSTSLRSVGVTIDAEPRTASPLTQRLDLTLKLNLRNRLVGGPLVMNDLPVTGVDVAQRTTSAALRRLPSSVVATTVVEFGKPLRIADVYRLLGRHGLLGEYMTPDVALYLEPARVKLAPGDPFALRVSWPNANIAQFQAWVKKLRSSDDAVLQDLSVPPVETLRAIAHDPRVYGVVLDDVTPQRLDGLFRDPSVTSVSVGDIGFHAGRPSS
jgi:hypothetical protein